MPTIRIDEEVYSWLRNQAIPFEDTPNSVLRRLAGFDKKCVEEVPNQNVSLKINEEQRKMNTAGLGTGQSKRLTGKHLADSWNVSVKHALYHQDGKWYQHLKNFPGALFDPNGYVIIHSQSEYDNSPYLQQGVELHVPDGIQKMPGYRRMK